MRASPERASRLISIFLLLYIVVAAVVLWFVDLVTQQRVFGFLLSGALTAFSMLVYIYRVQATKDYDMKLNRSWLIIGVVALVVLALLGVIVSL